MLEARGLGHPPAGRNGLMQRCWQCAPVLLVYVHVQHGCPTMCVTWHKPRHTSLAVCCSGRGGDTWALLLFDPAFGTAVGACALWLGSCVSVVGQLPRELLVSIHFTLSCVHDGFGCFHLRLAAWTILSARGCFTCTFLCSTSNGWVLGSSSAVHAALRLLNIPAVALQAVSLLWPGRPACCTLGIYISSVTHAPLYGGEVCDTHWMK